MTLESVYAGEDVPIVVEFDDGTTDPDDQATDGTPDADITITNADTDTEAVSAEAMTHESTGVFEYVWDTTAAGSGSYIIEVTAEFGGETKIVKDRIGVR